MRMLEECSREQYQQKGKITGIVSQVCRVEHEGTGVCLFLTASVFLDVGQNPTWDEQDAN